MNRKAIIISISFIIAIALSLTLFTWLVTVHSNVTEQKAIYIHENTTLDSLCEILNEKEAIKSRVLFRAAARIWRLKDNIKPGRYIIQPGMSNKHLVRMFKLGLQEPHNLVISGNITNMGKLASILSAAISADSASVFSALTNDSLISSLGFNRNTFPSMFILNTYQIYWTTTPSSLLKRMHKEYNQFWNSSRKEKASQLNLDPKEVSTLASIVAMESNLASEHPVIAGVYINRLKRGIPLQADPTIKYALKDPGIKRILYKHLEVESPYNTYKYKGLPPGPVAVPSPSVIDAVLNYSRHNYLYFCASAALDGTHIFSRTLFEHNRKAREYHRAINKLNL